MRTNTLTYINEYKLALERIKSWMASEGYGARSEDTNRYVKTINTLEAGRWRLEMDRSKGEISATPLDIEQANRVLPRYYEEYSPLEEGESLMFTSNEEDDSFLEAYFELRQLFNEEVCFEGVPGIRVIRGGTSQKEAMTDGEWLGSFLRHITQEQGAS